MRWISLRSHFSSSAELPRYWWYCERVKTTVHDVRAPLPLPDTSTDAVFAHRLLCMDLSTE